MSDKKISKAEKVESYTITISGGTRDRVVKLSSKMFRLDTASAIILLATNARIFPWNRMFEADISFARR